MKAIQRFGQQSKFLLVAEAVAFVVLLGVLDHLTGREFSFSLFYLIPILLVTHFVGKWAGIMLSFASAFTWLLADLMEALPTHTRPSPTGMPWSGSATSWVSSTFSR